MWPFQRTKTANLVLGGDIRMQVITLPLKEYRKKYNSIFDKKPDIPQEELKEEFGRFREKLIRNLNEMGTESPSMDGDYAVSDELQDAFFLCGAIYTNKMAGAGYLKAVRGAFEGLPHASRWAFHTVCEIWLNEDEPKIGDGEFFVTGDRIYAPDDGQDYAGVFAK